MKTIDFNVLRFDVEDTKAVVLDSDMSRLPKVRRHNSVSLNPKIVDDIMDYEWPLEKPVPCGVMQGKKWTDYVNNTFRLLFCLDSFLDVLQETTQKTWTTTPIDLILSKGVKPAPTPISWLRFPIGCGALHDSGAFIPLEEKNRLGYQDLPYGVSFDLHTWNGEDLFRPPMPRGFFFVTPKLTAALREAKLSGISLTPAAEYGKN